MTDAKERSVEIDAQTFKRLEDTARARGITVKELIRLKLDSWLKQKAGTPN